MSIYLDAPRVQQWLTPPEQHNRWRPFCANDLCACHYDEARMELLTRLVEHKRLGGDQIAAIYGGGRIEFRKARESCSSN